MYEPKLYTNDSITTTITTTKKKKKILAPSQSPQIWKEIKHILMVVISVGGSLGGLF